ncbi:MAG TPA: hypothetical protein VML96_11190 [Egibacteraceae bacterium]|nr:hypothetical protein [Egibacteraceae bacterium]
MDFGLAAVALVAGFPLLLLGGVLWLERLEGWMVQPDVRGDALARLIEQALESDELEARAVRLLSPAEPANLERWRVRARSRTASA